MSTIKGSNLRIFLSPRHYCIAAETSCELNINVETTSIASKDTPGNFEEIDVVGKKWSIKGKSLFFPNLVSSTDDVVVDTLTLIEQESYFISDEWSIPLKAGEMISAKIKTNHHPDSEPVIVKEDGTIAGTRSYIADEDCIVYLACREEVTMFFFVLKTDPTAYDEQSFISAINGNHPIQISLAITDENDNNREINNTLVSGEAYFTDLAINSRNKEHVTASFTATGHGELYS